MSIESPEMTIKCPDCRKRRQLFGCRCGKHVCLRCMSTHACTYDYKKETRDKLASELTKVEAPKVTPIN